jgi:hypothetical protein
MTQHDPCRAFALACRTGGDHDGRVGALQPLDLLFKLGDPLLLRAQRAAERLLSSRDQPSFVALPRLGCAKSCRRQRSLMTFADQEAQP